MEDAGLLALVRRLKACGWSNENIMVAITSSIKRICEKVDKEEAGD